jgi:ribosomal protein S25
MHTHCAGYASRSQAWSERTDLSAIARSLVDVLDRRTRHVFRECWLSTEKLASILGVSVATVRRALVELLQKGIIETVANYALRARRAIVLLWRVPAAAPVPVAPVPAPVVEPPPPPAPRKPRKETTPPPTHAERVLIDRAEAKFGPQFTVPVIHACERYGVLWVEKAINDTPAEKPWKWLLGKLEGWREAGKPQSAPEGPTDWVAKSAANHAAIERWRKEDEERKARESQGVLSRHDVQGA